MSVARLGLDHPDAIPRMLRAWDAGMDTAYIAAFIGVSEAQAEAILAEERERRRRHRIESEARKARFAQAWAGEDADRAEVARRFGYPNTAAASNARWRQRRAAGATRPAAKPITLPERNRMRAMREDKATIPAIAAATIPAIAAATGRGTATVYGHVKDIPFRAHRGRKPDLARLRRIAAADAVAEIGTRDELAGRFGLAHRNSFAAAATRARRFVTEAHA